VDVVNSSTSTNRGRDAVGLRQPTIANDPAIGNTREEHMGKLDGQVAFITGAARGQGRAHAIRLAQEGADIVAIDICQQIESVVYQMSKPDDLDETVRQVEALGRRIVAREADVRDLQALQDAFDDGVAELGPVTIVVANAGIGPGGFAPAEQQWDEVIGVNLTGVWNTGRVAIPSIVANGQGGSIVLTSSTGGLTGSPSDVPGMLGYTAAKHGVIGLMRSWANFLAPHSIRVNSVAPTTVATPMANDGDVSMILKHVPELANSLTNALPVQAVEAVDVANTVAWLASDEARYITGTVIPVDAGNINRR
jgi:SDR family mycofactocin-dependent oxidoreductase